MQYKPAITISDFSRRVLHPHAPGIADAIQASLLLCLLLCYFGSMCPLLLPLLVENVSCIFDIEYRMDYMEILYNVVPIKICLVTIHLFFNLIHSFFLLSF